MRQTRLIPFFTCCLLIAALPIHAGKTLTVTAGNLQALYNTQELKYENDLTLKGTINGTDIKLLRTWAANTRTLNLKECRIDGPRRAHVHEAPQQLLLGKLVPRDLILIARLIQQVFYHV